MENTRRKVSPLCLLLALFSGLLPGNAHSWGLSTELKEGWAEARLVFPALRERRIRYCIRNEEPSRFDSASVALQVESALRVWLAPLKKQGIPEVEIARVDCAKGDFHLLVQIGQEAQWKNLGSYQLSSWDDHHYYSLVKFDSGFLSDYDGSRTPITDFRKFAREPAAEKSLLQTLSFTQPQTVSSFSQAQGLDLNLVFWSTYPSLIHELGHSFGLCDTYDATVKDQCDPDFSSATHPSSVMKDSSYFYLTDDDVTGIERLFQRFR